jgi:tetratricopeptide (TPR) repeat protein
MNPRQPPTVFAPPTRPAPAAPDAFALAGARLNAQRPLRDARLQPLAALLQGNQLPQAYAGLAAHLARQPDDADAMNLQARAAVRLGRHAEAAALLARVLELAPDFALARFNLAHLLLQQHRYDEAQRELATLLAQDPANPLFRQMQAGLLQTLGDASAAAAIFHELAEQAPQRAESWLDLGHALRASGAGEGSVAAYRRAIACRPSCGLAWWALANLRTVRLGEADLRALQAQIARSDTPPADRAALLYALAKAHEDQGDAGPAFEAYAQGNALMRQRIRYDPAALGRSVAHQRAVFTADFFAHRRGAGCLSTEPIFILGRPRSGSTLVEQMLASHPAIEGTAELPYIGDLAANLADGPDAAFGTRWLDALAALPPDALQALGEAYLQRAARHRHLARPHFIDKMPANFFHTGFILSVLPRAKIIDVRRQPEACCWSIFKSFSSKGSLGLAELGRFHRDYLDLMAHFDEVQPGRIHRLQYEDLVRQPEAELRHLLDYLGLPFDSACLNFHETRRTVLTPSSEQVRRPLSTQAIDRWRVFEPWLGPLVDALDAGPARAGT